MEDYMGRACSTNGAKRNAYRIFVGKPEGKRPLGKPRRRWADNIKIELGWDGTDWIDLPQDRGQWRALLNTVMNLRVP
jgi:transposase